MQKGTVKWFSNQKGYGFIEYEQDGELHEVFVHFTGIEMDGYKTLTKDQEVLFELTKSHRGPQATSVKVTEQNLGASDYQEDFQN